MMKILSIIVKSPKIVFGLFLMSVLIGCTQNVDKAKKLVENSIEAHGGQNHYEAFKAISFKKTIRLFLEDGSLESEVIQQQSFQLRPDYRVQIVWDTDGKEHQIFYDGKRAIKTIDGKVVKDSIEIVKATNAAKAAAYVFFQPFDLLKESASLTFEGDVDLNDSTSARAVSVKYDGDNELSDKWTYYFNDDDLLIANSVILVDHNSLIENLELQNVNGLIFNRHRKSYRVDGNLNKKYLRAEYFYEDVAVIQ